MKPRRRALLACLIATVLGLAAAPAAQGGATHLIPNWPELLPAFPGTPSGTVSPGLDVCPTGGAGCPQCGDRRDERRWAPLDSSATTGRLALTTCATTEQFATRFDGRPELRQRPALDPPEDAIFAQPAPPVGHTSKPGETVPLGVPGTQASSSGQLGIRWVAPPWAAGAAARPARSRSGRRAGRGAAAS